MNNSYAILTKLKQIAIGTYPDLKSQGSKLTGSFGKNEDQPYLVYYSSCLMSSKNNTHIEAKEIVVVNQAVRTTSLDPNNNYTMISPILLDPSIPFQPPVWEKININLRRTSMNKFTSPKLTGSFGKNEDQPYLVYSSSCLMSSKNNNHIEAKEVVVVTQAVRKTALFPNSNYTMISTILLDPSIPFQPPDWEKININLRIGRRSTFKYRNLPQKELCFLQEISNNPIWNNKLI